MNRFGKGHDHGSWYKDWRDHPSELTKGKEISRFPLTELQQSCNVHEPIEAYEEKWEHVETKDEDGNTNVLAFPVEGTRRQSDLPPLAQQWKQDWKRRTRSNETQ